ncbi:MAG: hypothetical protein JSV19_03395 [Phycisphaerales bacterium]|nr:MAG: hypothetical protein JSV19_03395 [Phycisphaerales bacterium]
MKNSKLVMAALAVMGLTAVPAMGVGYKEVVTWDTLNAGGASTSHFGVVVEGQTSYHNLTFPGRITKVENLDGVQTATEWLSTMDWFIANGGATSNMSSWYGFGISGDYVQWADSGTDSIWRLDKNAAGSIAEYVSAADIIAHTGEDSSQVLSPQTVAPNGEHTFYEGRSDSILMTTGPGAVITLVSEAELVAETGSNSANGGLTYDLAGNLYWGDSTSDSMYMKAASDGSLSKVLDKTEIIAVSGETAAGFGDIFGAPNGMVYFYESTGDNIMRFDPADPPGTLEIYVSEAELLAGPAGSDAVVCMTWYGNIAWHRFNEYGLYVAQEPPGLDIKPGSCPNSFNRKSRGALHVAICGLETFDVTTIDIASVRLSRVDGIGGQVAPHEGPPGPHSFFYDAATPYYGESCHELEGDSIVDLLMHFKNETVTAILELDALPPGALVELVVTGSLLDGSPFTTAIDRIRLVPPGTPPGLVAVSSTIPDVWIDAYPLDLQLDDGGFADFERSYPQTTVVTYVAPRMADGVRFAYWEIDGEPQARGRTAIDFEVAGDVMEAKAVFLNPGVQAIQGAPVEPIEMQPIGGGMQPASR